MGQAHVELPKVTASVDDGKLVFPRLPRLHTAEIARFV
jgi:hypothetical protein